MSEQIHLGFIPLLDCAPLVAAKNLGLFDESGLDVVLHKEHSWASLIEKIHLNVYQGGHMLTPVLVADALHSQQSSMISPINMGLNGNAITLSHRLTNADITLAELAQQQRQRGDKLTFAVVYPFSMHNYQLRLWLEQQGVDPATDVQIRTIPPQKMWQTLANEEIDGFCVGEPWNSFAQQQGGCSIVASGYDVWPDAPEKSLGLNRQWASGRQDTVVALTRAVYQACQWLEDNSQSPELVQWLQDSSIVSLPSDIIKQAIKSCVGKKKFFSNQATEPSADKTRSIALHIKRWQPDWVIQDIEAAFNAFDLDTYLKATAGSDA